MNLSQTDSYGNTVEDDRVRHMFSILTLVRAGNTPSVEDGGIYVADNTNMHTCTYWGAKGAPILFSEIGFLWLHVRIQLEYRGVFPVIGYYRTPGYIVTSWTI